MEMESQQQKQKKRVPRQQPQNLNEARSTYTNKLLLNVNKMTETSKDAHIQLVFILFKHLLKYQYNKQIDFFSQFSLLKDYCNNTGMNIYYDNENMTNFIKLTLGDNDNQTVYLKLLYGIVELINMNILNYIVYVDYNKFGKNKLFNIIETVIFTQILPAEMNKHELEFKQLLKSEIKALKEKVASHKTVVTQVDQTDQTVVTTEKTESWS